MNLDLTALRRPITHSVKYEWLIAHGKRAGQWTIVFGPQCLVLAIPDYMHTEYYEDGNAQYVCFTLKEK